MDPDKVYDRRYIQELDENWETYLRNYRDLERAFLNLGRAQAGEKRAIDVVLDCVDNIFERYVEDAKLDEEFGRWEDESV